MWSSLRTREPVVEVSYVAEYSDNGFTLRYTMTGREQQDVNDKVCLIKHESKFRGVRFKFVSSWRERGSSQTLPSPW